MSATAFATIAAFQVIFFGEHDIALGAQVIIFRIEFLFKHPRKDRK